MPLGVSCPRVVLPMQNIYLNTKSKLKLHQFVIILFWTPFITSIKHHNQTWWHGAYFVWHGICLFSASFVNSLRRQLNSNNGVYLSRTRSQLSFLFDEGDALSTPSVWAPSSTHRRSNFFSGQVHVALVSTSYTFSENIKIPFHNKASATNIPMCKRWCVTKVFLFCDEHLDIKICDSASYWKNSGLGQNFLIASELIKR